MTRTAVQDMLSDAASVKSGSTDYAEGIVQKLKDVPPLQMDPSSVTDVRKVFTHSHTTSSSSHSSSSADPFSHITVEWNEVVQEVLGYDAKIGGDIEPTVQWWLQRIHRDDRTKVSEQLHAHFGGHPDWACAEARLCYLEYRIQRKDGSWLFVGDRITTCRDKLTGLPTVSESFCFDHAVRFGGVAPDKRADFLGEDNFKLVAQNMHSALYMMNAHGYVTFMNAAAERLTGFKFEEISNITFHDAVHSLYPDGSGYPIHECPIYGHQVRNESVQDAEEVFVDRNGRYFDIRYSVAPLSGGYQYGAVIEFRDVTEEKRRERQRLTAMMDNEHQAARVRHEELMRAQMSGFVDFVAHEVRNPLHGITANGSFLLESLEQLEALFLASPNNTPVSSRAPSPTKSPTTFGSPTSPRGRSKTKQTAAEIFSSARIYLRAIDECASHQSHILNNLLDLSRLAAGKVQLLEEAFSPWDTTEQAMRMVSAKAAERGITLTLDTSTERIKNVLLNGDETSFRQVFLNLLGNATKFAYEGGKVSVRLDIQDGPDGDSRSILIGSVQDDGVGMTEKEMSLLFERFGQASRKVSNVYGGSGLGLAISRQLVRLMDGDISVTSKKNVGSVFRFTAMLEESKAEDRAKWLDRHLASRLQFMGNGQPTSALRMRGDLVTAIDTSTEHIQSTRGRPTVKYKNVVHILAAEDNKINQAILGKYLKAVPKVKLVDDGKEAYEYFLSEEGKSLDLIIMDVMMPVWGGVQATKKIREYEQGETVSTKRKRIPIIGLSGNARTEQAEAAKDAGMDDYLCKPCSKKMLEDMLVKWDGILDGKEVQT